METVIGIVVIMALLLAVAGRSKRREMASVSVDQAYGRDQAPAPVCAPNRCTITGQAIPDPVNAVDCLHYAGEVAETGETRVIVQDRWSRYPYSETEEAYIRYVNSDRVIAEDVQLVTENTDIEIGEVVYLYRGQEVGRG